MLISAQDIRNDRVKIKKEHLNGRSPIETLLDDLSTSDWIFDVKRDSDNRVQYLFFAHRKQVEMQRANPDVLMMDCTYRTNKYRMPLLHILGCTNLQTFFSAGFCFLRNETDLDYYWAVSTFIHKMRSPPPRVFISDHEDALKSAVSQLLPRVPQLLCIGNVNRNVQTKAQRAWRTADGKTKAERKAMEDHRAAFMGRWAQVVYSKTEAEFQSKWDTLLSDCKSQDGLCEYLQQYQYPVRHQWARAWTSQYRHYDTTSTSPIEGMHKVLKDYLVTSAGNLLRVVERIDHMVENQYHKYRNDIASARNTIKHEHRLEKMPFLPVDIHQTITPPAIEHVRKQNELRKKHQRECRSPPCTGSFERINGLPCYHTLQAMENAGTSLRMTDFDDDHWRYQRREGHSILPPPPRPYQFVLDPLTIRSRGAPRKSEASTRRHLSAFERPVPASSNPSQLGTLTEVTQHTQTTTRTSLSPDGVPVTTTAVSESQTAIYVSSSPQSCSSSEGDASSPKLNEASASKQPAWQPPTLEEFEEDIRRRQRDPVVRGCGDPATLHTLLEATGQEDDPIELVLAREMALDTTGVYADCTPRMAWNCHFGDKQAFWDERAARVRARDPFSEAHLASGRPLKRAAPGETQADMVAPTRKKRGPRRCGTCNQEGHNSRTCKIGAGGLPAVQGEQAVADSVDIEAGSESELAEDAVIVVGITEKKRRCGTCHQEGHNSRTCQPRSAMR